MKILFAVNNESISESIIKKYQQDYKEIISSKNVYYFDAITRELQKDKTYDRIIISEDVEPFANNNYNVIDKFIFDRLDNISDEATSIDGQDIPIILICTDRRAKSENFLVKLFGIGVYSALLGQDRTISNVCQLINKPRSKKEAKIYYRIDTDDVEYKSEHEEDVSEEEIQNILNHYKRLGKNEDEYVRSFDNIAEQYTETQLKVICRFLPLNVKAVLEERSPKYQEIVTFSTSPVNNVQKQPNKSSRFKIGKEKSKNKVNYPKKEILEKNIGKSELTKPVIIPSAIGQVSVVETNNNSSKIDRNDIIDNSSSTKNIEQRNMELRNNNSKQVREEQTYFEQLNYNHSDNNIVDNNYNDSNIVNNNHNDNNVIDNNYTRNREIKDEDEVNDILNFVENEQNNKKVAEIQNIEPPKKKRGRPRKVENTDGNIDNVEEKPKKKRGRPRKVDIENSQKNELKQEETVNLFELDNNEEHTEKKGEIILPGLEDDNSFPNSISNKTNKYQDKNDEEQAPSLFNFYEEESDKTQNYKSNENYNDELIKQQFQTQDENQYNSSKQGIGDYDSSQENQQYDAYNSNQGNEQYNSYNSNQRNEQYSAYNSSQENEQYNLYNSNQELGQSSSWPNSNEKKEQYANTSREIEQTNQYQDVELKNNLLSMSNKLVAFVGTSKNGTSFLVNNMAEILSGKGIKTAILDLTQNKNAYYIYTKNDENLRRISYNCIRGLQSGVAKGIEVNKNLTVYTTLPERKDEFNDYKNIITTLMKNYSLILMDCDYETRYEYFDLAKELYLVQSYDILTIQPLTAFLRNLKTRNMLDPQKLRVVLNKVLRVRSITDRVIIGGMSSYNDPSMSYMTELFDRDNIKSCSIPFEQETYSRYLDGLVNCEISTKGYSKNFMVSLDKLANLIYPLLNNDKSVNKFNNYNTANKFSNNMNQTLNKMKNRY